MCICVGCVWFVCVCGVYVFTRSSSVIVSLGGKEWVFLAFFVGVLLVILCVSGIFV